MTFVFWWSLPVEKRIGCLCHSSPTQHLVVLQSLEVSKSNLSMLMVRSAVLSADPHWCVAYIHHIPKVSVSFCPTDTSQLDVVWEPGVHWQALHALPSLWLWDGSFSIISLCHLPCSLTRFCSFSFFICFLEYSCSWRSLIQGNTAAPYQTPPWTQPAVRGMGLDGIYIMYYQ